MQLYLSSKRQEILEKAQAYLEENLDPGAWKKTKEYDRSSVEYSVKLEDEAAKALLDRLLALSSDLDISGTLIYDLEDRDRSFWGSTSYRSAVDQNGKRCFEVSSSTGWA